MTITLSDEQRQALQSGMPVEVSDGRETVYVISKEAYERMKGILKLEGIDPSFYEFTDTEVFGVNNE